MSLETWKAEFYPTEPTKEMTPLEAAQHSLTKWQGATPTNCAKHGVEYGAHAITPSSLTRKWFDEFSFTGTTCALCEVFYDEDKYTCAPVEEPEDDPCFRCPLFTLGFGCNEPISPYEQSVDSPFVMIAALEDVVVMLEQSSNGD